MTRVKHVVVFSPTAGWALHAAKAGGRRALCGRAMGGWSVHRVPLKSVECKTCRKALGIGVIR